jgi:CubicO group peptidase (beta-lactamase class C family)
LNYKTAMLHFLISSLIAACDAKTPRSLVTEFVQTLNTKDDAKLRSFITMWSAPGGPVAQRVDRFGAFAKQAGPFEIIGDGPETEAEVDEIVSDRDHSRLVIRLMIKKKPALIINGLTVAPAYTVEGPSAEFSHWTTLDDLAHQISKSTQSPGMGIAVIRGGKEDLGVAGIRKAGSSEPIRKDDVWSIGSIGKSLCSTVIGALIDKGKLRWDETLSEALPNFEMKPGYKRVTLEQIMHHRGGIPPDLGFTGARVFAIVKDAKTPTAQRENYARDILSRKPIAVPDERFEYSNAGYALLSVIAERAAKKPYEALLHDLIFQPLGLRHSFTDVDRLPDQRPSGHELQPSGLEPANMTGPIEAILAGAGGGIFMSVGDLATYGQAHLNGMKGRDGLLKAATFLRLHHGVPEVPGGRFYACGWGTENVPTLLPFVGHNGSNGTMRSQIAIFPGVNMVVVAIVNCGGEFEPSPGFSAVMAVAQRYASKAN